MSEDKTSVSTFADFRDYIINTVPIGQLIDRVIKEMPIRATEDIDEWADKLANDVCGLTD